MSIDHELLIMQFCSISCHFIPIRHKYFSAPFSQTLLIFCHFVSVTASRTTLGTCMSSSIQFKK